MSEANTLEEKILNALRKTGFPTEIICASILQDHNWFVLLNPSYWDKEERKSREFDIRGFRMWNEKNREGKLTNFLVIECKKSVNPWVFFVTEERIKKVALGRYIKTLSSRKLFRTIYSDGQIIDDDDLRVNHHYFHSKVFASTFTEPLKGKENESHYEMIYKAIMSVIKATLFHYYDQVGIALWDSIYYPLIVFDGPLYQAEIDPDETIRIEKANHIRLAFNYIPQDPVGSKKNMTATEEFIVDVIHVDFLDQFLYLIEEENELFAEKL